eukprot:537862-Lingulodinium_polyedra.AAC.1
MQRGPPVRAVSRWCRWAFARSVRARGDGEVTRRARSRGVVQRCVGAARLRGARWPRRWFRGAVTVERGGRAG